MVFGIDPRSRLKSELTLSEMRLVLVTSRSAIIFLADKAMLRKRDYSSVYQPRIPEPTGDRPLGNSIGVLLGCTFG